MTDKPKIEVGQRWVTRDGTIVRILSVSADGSLPVVGQYPSKAIELWLPNGRVDEEGISGSDLISLAPQTVKREVALYRWICGPNSAEMPSACGFVSETTGPQHPNWHRISEPVTIEFTLLPGESADA